jgi:3'-phosphoadenosine 5'-phosphosulfate sulfotransferase (PAPS reductase)/FAD synthetase
MFIINSNYSNNSLALIQWAYEHSLEDVTVCYIDTGWAGDGWLEHVTKAEQFVSDKGFKVVRLQSRINFEDLMVMKKGFPNQKHQWCGLHLKGITFLQWLDQIDPETKATILFGKRNNENHHSEDVTEYIENSDYHGERRVWHPLFKHSEEERNQLLERADIIPLPHRSLECDPCINSNIADLRRLSDDDIAKGEALEEELQTNMFCAASCNGATDIRHIVKWAREKAQEDELSAKYGCSSAFGCGV